MRLIADYFVNRVNEVNSVTKAQKVDYLASTAGMLASSYGEVFAMPGGKGAVEWCSGPLRAILWADGQTARIDLFNNGRKVMATAWQPGAARHELIAFKPGPWVQALETAGRAMVEGMGLAGGTVH